MRPLRLELEGFTAFRQTTCLDLSDLDLFAITGPTGAGKSSLIDAVCYALYGRVPRVTTEVAACISQGLDRMRVALEFMAGEERFRVFRETRRKGSPNVRLDRWQEDEWRAVADRAHDVTAEVTRIVGLDYDGFTRSVLLPQGQFQEFLAGAADKRRAVLRSLLRLEVYDRMRARAGATAAELKTRLDERERTLADLADATPESLTRMEGVLEEKRRTRVRLQAEVQTLAAGLELAQALGRERERLCAAETESAAAEESLHTTRGLVEEGDAALTTAREDLDALQARIAANHFDPERLAALTLGRERARDLARSDQELRQATAAQKESATAEERADAQSKKLAAALRTAETALAAAEAALHEAQRHNLAAALQHGLHAGDACPVCGGTVGELPAVEGNGVAAAQTGHDAARKAESAARTSFHAASTAATRASAAVEAAERRVEELSEQRRRRVESLEEALPADDDRSLAAIETALASLTESMAERQRLESAAGDLASRHDELKSQLDQARQALAALEQRAGAAHRALDEARRAVEHASIALAELASKAGWRNVAAAPAAGDDVAAVLKGRLESAQAEQHEVTHAAGQTEERLKRLKEDIEKARTLRKELQTLKQEHYVADDLARMLMANRFQAYVQQEALATLAADGSRRLERLSAERYRLRLDEKAQEFEVIDKWNDEEARSVKTLSGGETFLASLALSLALAESLPGLSAGHRVVLDSIFLDEGFGSLDAEALDRAADALDALRGENRMVCVVTHLGDLAQRLPARVVVAKSETGSSVSVS